MELKTDYKDYAFFGNKKFKMITNQDGTVSFEDVTRYSVIGDDFGSEDVNNITSSINSLNNSSLPEGGSTGQVLGKASDANFDVSWVNQTGGTGQQADYDSLPVGSVIDYEGTEVPDGYEKVSETEKKVWTNPNPTSSFSSQTINLDIEGFDYDELEIMSYNQVSEKYELYNKIQKLGKGRITDQWAGTVGVGCRSRIFNNNTESTIKFENANNTIGTTAAKTDNEGCVPMQVIARKRGGSI